MSKSRGKSANPNRLLTEDVRARILLRQHWICFYCPESLRGKILGQTDGYVFDHVTPRSLGGADGEENRVAACFACDVVKGRRLPTRPEWQELERQRRAQEQI